MPLNLAIQTNKLLHTLPFMQTCRKSQLVLEQGGGGEAVLLFIAYLVNNYSKRGLLGGGGGSKILYAFLCLRRGMVGGMKRVLHLLR